jgi:hypothetical protein
MPPRHFIWAIVVFWLATSVWLFCWEYLPRFRADQPPDFFQPQFADEVRTRQLRWTIFQDKEAIGSPRGDSIRVGSGITEFRRRRKNRVFEISCELSFNNLGFTVFQIQRMESTYQIGPHGELRELGAQVGLRWVEYPRPFEITLNGKVEGERFTSHLRLTGPMNKEWQLAPIAVSRQDCFLNPLHPLDKVSGLYEGRFWRIHLINPLDGLTSKLALFHSPEINILECSVTTARLFWEGQQVTCWVIDYRSPGKGKTLARTWVRKSDDWILRQESNPFGKRLIIDRGVSAR